MYSDRVLQNIFDSFLQNGEYKEKIPVFVQNEVVMWNTFIARVSYEQFAKFVDVTKMPLCGANIYIYKP